MRLVSNVMTIFYCHFPNSNFYLYDSKRRLQSAPEGMSHLIATDAVTSNCPSRRSGIEKPHSLDLRYIKNGEVETQIKNGQNFPAAPYAAPLCLTRCGRDGVSLRTTRRPLGHSPSSESCFRPVTTRVSSYTVHESIAKEQRVA